MYSWEEVSEIMGRNVRARISEILRLASGRKKGREAVREALRQWETITINMRQSCRETSQRYQSVVLVRERVQRQNFCFMFRRWAEVLCDSRMLMLNCSSRLSSGVGGLWLRAHVSTKARAIHGWRQASNDARSLRAIQRTVAYNVPRHLLVCSRTCTFVF